MAGSRRQTQYGGSSLTDYEEQRQVAQRAQADQQRADNIQARQLAHRAAIARGVNPSMLPSFSSIKDMSDKDWANTAQRIERISPTPASVATPPAAAAPAATVTAPALAALPAPADGAQRGMMRDYFQGKANTKAGVISQPGDSARIAAKYGGDSTTKANAEPGYYGPDGKYLGAATYDNAGNVTSQMPKGATGFVGRGSTPSTPPAVVATNINPNMPVTPIGSTPAADPLAAMPAPAVAPLAITNGQKQTVGGVSPNLDLTSPVPAFNLPPSAAAQAGANARSAISSAANAVVNPSLGTVAGANRAGPSLATPTAAPLLNVPAAAAAVQDFGAGFVAGKSGTPGTNPAPTATQTPTTPPKTDELDKDYLKNFGSTRFDGF